MAPSELWHGKHSGVYLGAIHVTHLPVVLTGMANMPRPNFTDLDSFTLFLITMLSFFYFKGTKQDW